MSHPSQQDRGQMDELIRVVLTLTRTVAATANVHPPQPPVSILRRPQSLTFPAPGGANQSSTPWWSPQPSSSEQLSSRCLFCSDPRHFVKDCPEVENYLHDGRVIHSGPNRRVTLPNSDFPRRDLPGTNLKEGVDSYWREKGIQQEIDA